MTRIPLVLAAALLAGSLGAAAISRGLGGGPAPPNGLPSNLDGTTWLGTARAKAYDLSTTPDPGVESAPCTLQFVLTQLSEDITIEMTVTCPGKTAKVFMLQGEVGNYHFWAEGPAGGAEGTGTEEILLSGHIAPNGTKMKGVGIAVEDDGADVTAFKFNARIPTGPY